MRLKLATYNIQFGRGQDGRYDLDRIVAALPDQDIVCLQEVTTHWQACGGDDQPRLLAERLDRYAAFAPGYEVDASTRDAEGRVVNARRGFGNMVLSRWPIAYSRAHALPRPAAGVALSGPGVDLPRSALEAVIEVEGQALRVFSIHLSHLAGPQRAAQIDALHALVAGLPEEPRLWATAAPEIAPWAEGLPAPAVPAETFLMGDFNCEPESADYARLMEGLSDAWDLSDERLGESGTCLDEDGLTLRLDYLFVSPRFQGHVRSARVDHATLASDHFPVFFELEL